MAILDDMMKTAEEAVRNRVNRVNPGAAIDRRPADSNLDWLNRSLQAARDAANERRRKEEEKRRAAEEERRIEDQVLRADRRPQPKRLRATPNPLGGDVPEWVQPSPTRTRRKPVVENQTPEQRARDWALSMEGRTILSGTGNPSDFDSSSFDGSAREKEAQRLKDLSLRAGRKPGSEAPKDLGIWAALAKNNMFREFNWGQDPETFAMLVKKGVPPEIIVGLNAHFQTEKGQQDFKKIGVRDYGGPVSTVVGDVTGNQFVGDMAGLGMYAVPYVGTVLGGTEAGLRPGEDEGWPLFWESLGVAGDAVTMGKAAQLIERGVEARVAGKVGENYMAKLAARMGSRGLLNTAEEVPITAAYLQSQGVDPTSEEGREILALSAALSFSTGGAIPLASDVAKASAKGTAKGVQALDKVPGGRVAAESAGAAGAAYGASEITGGDEDENLRRALMAGALPGATRLGRRAVDRFTPMNQGLVPESAGRVRPASPVDVQRAAEGTYEGRVRTSDETVGIDTLNGGPSAAADDAARVRALADSIAGPDGYIERLVVDADGTVIEGAHRLAALRALGVTDVPVTRVSPVASSVPGIDAVRAELAERLPLRREQVNQLLDYAGEALDEEGGNVAALREYSIPGFEREWDEVVNAIERADSTPSPRAALLPEDADPTREMSIEEFRNRMRKPQIESRPPLVDDRSLPFRLNDLTSDPYSRAAIQGGGMAAYGFATSDEDDFAGRMEDAAGIAMLGTGRSLLGNALSRRVIQQEVVKGVTKASKIEDFHVGGKAYNPVNGKVLGEIVGVDQQGGSLKVRNLNGKVRLIPADKVLNERDFTKNISEAARAKALEPVTPSDMVVEARAKDMGEAIEQARVLTDNPRIMSRALEKLGLGAIDPATKFDTPVKRNVLTAVVAAASEQRAELAKSVAHVRNLWKVLEPITQESGPRFQKGMVDVSLHDLKRAGAQLGAAGAPAAAGYVAGEATGHDELKEAGILAGLVGMASLSHAQGRGFMRQTPWDKIELNLEDPEMPAFLKQGQGKLIDIIERPDAYNLPPEARAAIDQYNELRRAYLRETNASLKAAGLEMVPELEANNLFHWFTPESVRAAGLEQAPSAVEIHSPGFARAMPFEQMRKLGATYYEALGGNSKLKVAGTAKQLLQEEAKMHAGRRANALLVRALKQSDGAWKVPDYDKLAETMTPEEIRAIRQFEKDLREIYKFNQIPGVDDHLFHPEAVRAVNDLLVTNRGSENGVMTLLDDATNAVRQAMFVGDASAWTMQGMMAALEDPMAVLRNAHHLIGATAFGEKYFNWWLSKPENARLWKDYTRAGGMPGRQFEGLELDTADTKAGKVIHTLGIANKPGFKQVEARGFESFLPIHRALMFDNIRKQDAFIRRLKLNRAPGSRAAVEAAKFAPLGGSIAAAATDNEIDIPGLDDDMDKLFTLALGLGGSQVTRGAIQKEGRGALESMTLQDRFKLHADAGKHVNRISGNLNRQVMGISNRQSQLERVFGFRSPALARNAVTLAKHAATDFGPEGAMARLYLTKTLMLTGLALAALKWWDSGEWDSFDPRDPDSVFSPEMLMRADLGELGTFSPSNPLIALLRAGLHQEKPAGETRWQVENWRPDVGVSDWMKNRLPDVSGLATSNLFDKFTGDGLDDPNAKPSKGLLEKAMEGDVSGVAGSIAERTVPVSGREALDSGLLGKTAIGDRLGLKGNAAFNHPNERVANVIAALFGTNANPESLGKEATRLKTETTQDMFPNVGDRTGDGRITYDDLNQEQQGKVRDKLDKSGGYQDVTKRLEENREVEDSSPIQTYLDRQEAINEDYLTRLKAADAEYQRTGNAMEFKRTYQALSEERRIRRKEAKEVLGSESAKMRGRDETVEKWLSRNIKPEDEAVQAYYDLFDKATRADGRLNFDKLERLQQDYVKSLNPEMRGYLERRIASFDKPPEVGALADYEAAKAKAAPYFELREEQFQRVKEGDPFMSQFASLSEFEDAVESIANERGLTKDQLLSAFEKTNLTYRMFKRMSSLGEKFERLTDPELDDTLGTWYGFSPVSPIGKAEDRLEAIFAALELPQRKDFRQYDFGIGSRRYRD